MPVPKLLAEQQNAVKAEISEAVSHLELSVDRETSHLPRDYLGGSADDVAFAVEQISLLLECADKILHLLPGDVVSRIAEFHSNQGDLVLGLRNSITACGEIAEKADAVANK